MVPPYHHNAAHSHARCGASRSWVRAHSQRPNMSHVAELCRSVRQRAEKEAGASGTAAGESSHRHDDCCTRRRTPSSSSATKQLRTVITRQHVDCYSPTAFALSSSPLPRTPPFVIRGGGGASTPQGALINRVRSALRDATTLLRTHDYCGTHKEQIYGSSSAAWRALVDTCHEVENLAKHASIDEQAKIATLREELARLRVECEQWRTLALNRSQSIALRPGTIPAGIRRPGHACSHSHPAGLNHSRSASTTCSGCPCSLCSSTVPHTTNANVLDDIVRSQRAQIDYLTAELRRASRPLDAPPPRLLPHMGCGSHSPSPYRRPLSSSRR